AARGSRTRGSAGGSSGNQGGEALVWQTNAQRFAPRRQNKRPHERMASFDTRRRMILVDTSVIADVLTRDTEWFQWSSQQIESWGDKGPVCYIRRSNRWWLSAWIPSGRCPATRAASGRP